MMYKLTLQNQKCIIPKEFGTIEEYRRKFTEQDLFDEFTRNENGKIILNQEDAKDKIKKLGGYKNLYHIQLESNYLAERTWNGAKKRYGETLTEQQRSRIIFELHIIKKMNLSNYFLIAEECVNGIRDDLDISIGLYHDTIVCTVVAYCLQITNLDPLKRDLDFEYFWSLAHTSLPFAICFNDDNYGKVLDWATEKYGKEIINHIKPYWNKDMTSIITMQSVIKETLKIIKSHTNEEINIDSIPINDELTYQLYVNEKYLWKSSQMQKHIKNFKSMIIDDLIAMNTLCHSKSAKKVQSFIRRKQGLEKITHDLPCMELSLMETYGVTIYQEQIIYLSRIIADFTRSQSYALRKAMNKKQTAQMDELYDIFMKHGVSKQCRLTNLTKTKIIRILQTIWNDWKDVASNVSNKSHAVYYTWISYQTAYLKAHYPNECKFSLKNVPTK